MTWLMMRVASPVNLDVKESVQHLIDEATSSQSTKMHKKKINNEIKVQEIVDSLKSKHGTKYTVLQLRIWAELVSSGLYTGTEEPPCHAITLPVVRKSKIKVSLVLLKP